MVKKRKCRPRILKTDIRRSYAIMLANVFNSGSYQLVSSFLSHYDSHDAKVFFRPRLLNTEYSSGALVLEEIYRIKMIGDFWQAKVDATPDLVFRISDIFIKVKEDEQSLRIIHYVELNL